MNALRELSNGGASIPLSTVDTLWTTLATVNVARRPQSPSLDPRRAPSSSRSNPADAREAEADRRSRQACSWASRGDSEEAMIRTTDADERARGADATKTVPKRWVRSAALAIAAGHLAGCSTTQIVRFESSRPDARVSIQRRGEDRADTRSVPARYELAHANKTGPWALIITGTAFVAAGMCVVAYAATPDNGGFTELFSIPLLTAGAGLVTGGAIWAVAQKSNRYTAELEAPGYRERFELRLPLHTEGRRHPPGGHVFRFDGERVEGPEASSSKR